MLNYDQQSESLELISKASSIIPLLDIAAEEAVELAHALMKFSRTLRKENSTPVLPKDAFDAVVEENSDLFLCLKVLETHLGKELLSEQVLQQKTNRWLSRLRECDAPGSQT